MCVENCGAWSYKVRGFWYHIIHDMTWDEDERSPFRAPSWYSDRQDAPATEVEQPSCSLLDVFRHVSRASAPPVDDTRAVDYGFYLPCTLRENLGWCYEIGWESECAGLTRRERLLRAQAQAETEQSVVQVGST